MAEKKKKLWRQMFVCVDFTEAGANYRRNLMTIIMAAIAEMHSDAKFQIVHAGPAIMMPGDCAEPFNEALAIEKECLPYVQYTNDYSNDRLIEFGKDLAERCKEKGYTIGFTTFHRQIEKYGMNNELFVLDWEL